MKLKPMNLECKKILDKAIQDICDWNLSIEEVENLREYFSYWLKVEYMKSKDRI